MRKWGRVLAVVLSVVLSVPAVMPVCRITTAAQEQESQMTVLDYIDVGNETRESGKITASGNLNEAVTHSNNQCTYRTLGGNNGSNVEMDVTVLNETDTTAGNFGYIGYMDVTVRVDPAKENYITLVLWGEDTTADYEGNLFVVYMKPSETDSSKKILSIGDDLGSVPLRSSLPDRDSMSDINYIEGYNQMEDGFLYATYPIPKKAVTDYLEDDNKITLRIYSNKNYYWNGISASSLSQQTKESRGIYAVYVTDDACVTPERIRGAAMSDGYTTDTIFETHQCDSRTVAEIGQKYSMTNSEDVAEIKTTLNTILNSDSSKNYTGAIDKILDRQVYRTDGNENYPSYMKGLPSRSAGWWNNTTDTDWYSYAMNQVNQQNMVPYYTFEILAGAYTTDVYTGTVTKSEFLDRLVASYDFMTRSQGANGAYYCSSGWPGGLDRGEGTYTRSDAGGNNLTGFGLRYLGKSFVETVKYLKEQESATGQKWYDAMYMGSDIDSDADGNEDQTRANAYAAMFAKLRDYMTSLDGTGHAPNQDMVEIQTALYADQSLKLIDEYFAATDYAIDTVVDETTFGEYTYPFSWENQGTSGQKKIEDTIDIALGKKINRYHHAFWVSPKGMPLEAGSSLYGGYTGDYGPLALSEAVEIADLGSNYYGLEENGYDELVSTMYNAMSYYYFRNKSVSNDGTYQVSLFTEGYISTRNGHTPGMERYIYDMPGCLEYKNTIALKILRYYLEDSCFYKDYSNGSFAGTSYFEGNVIMAISLYSHFDELAAAMTTDAVTNYEFPREREENFAVADEMSRNVAIKDGDKKIYVALNWRHWMKDITNQDWIRNGEKKIAANNLARVHHTTSNYDQYGYARMNTKGFGTNCDDWEDETYEAGDKRRDTATYATSRYLEGLLTLSYDNYEIIMNCDKSGACLEAKHDKTDGDYDDTYDYAGTDRNWEFISDAGVAKGLYYDLISKEYIWIDSDSVVKPATTYVLKEAAEVAATIPIPDATILEMINANVLSLEDCTLSEANEMLTIAGDDGNLKDDYAALSEEQQREVLEIVNVKVVEGGSYKQLAGFLVKWKTATYQVRAVSEVTGSEEAPGTTSTQGAQLRLKNSEQTQGLRFYSMVNKEIVDTVVSSGGEFGMIIAPTIGLDKAKGYNENFEFAINAEGKYEISDASNEDFSYVRVPAKHLYEYFNDEMIPYHTYTAVLVGLKSTYYNRAFTARTYYIPPEAMDEKGNITDYSQIVYGTPIERSMREIAQACLDQEEYTLNESDKSYYRMILNNGVASAGTIDKTDVEDTVDISADNSWGILDIW